MKRRDALAALAIALAVAAILSPWASSAPDGLEWAAKRLGFMERTSEVRPIASPLAGYTMPGVKRKGVSTAVSGAVGTIIVAGVLMGAGALVRRRSVRLRGERKRSGDT